MKKGVCFLFVISLIILLGLISSQIEIKYDNDKLPKVNWEEVVTSGGVVIHLNGTDTNVTTACLGVGGNTFLLANGTCAAFSFSDSTYSYNHTLTAISNMTNSWSYLGYNHTIEAINITNASMYNVYGKYWNNQTSVYSYNHTEIYNNTMGTLIYNYTDVNGTLYYNHTSVSGWISDGTSVYLIDSTDNVGIGTATPRDKLEISEGGIWIETSGYDILAGFFRNNTGIGIIDNNAFEFRFKAQNNSNISFVDDSNNRFLYMIDGGKIGIGTNAASSKVDVNGSFRVTNYLPAATTGKGFELYYVPVSSVGYITTYDRDATAYLDTAIDGLELWLNAYSGGNVGIGNAAPTSKLYIEQSTDNETSGVTIVDKDNAATGRLFISTDNDFVLQKGLENDNQIVLDEGGNVGIGTSSPTHTLTVSGDTNSTGDIYAGDDLFVTDRLGIRTTSPTYPLFVRSGVTLYNITGNYTLLTRFQGNDLRGDYLQLKHLRTIEESSSSNWQKAQYKLQRQVDAVEMGYLAFGSEQQNPVEIGYGSTPYMTFEATTGDIGIGDTTPEYDLDVTGDIRATDDLFIDDDATISGSAGIGIAPSSYLLTISNSAISLNVSGMLYVNSTNVGINVTAPTHALEVRGDVNITNELKGTKMSNSFVSDPAITHLGNQETYLQNGDVQMSATKGFVMMRAGSITGMSINYDLSGVASTPNFQLNCKKNGATVYTIDMGTDVEVTDKTAYGTQARGTDNFVAGDIISFSVQTISSGDGTVDDMLVRMEYYYDT